MSSKVVYSTQISDEIKSLHHKWIFALELYQKNNTHSNMVNKNKAFINFADACEKEGREISKVTDLL